MPEINTISSVERLQGLATQLLQDTSAASGARVSQIGETTVVSINDELQVAHAGETLVVWGKVDTSRIGETAVQTLYTISFNGDSTEPTTFLRWDERRKDTGEGYSVPKRKREKIASHLVEILAA